MDENLVMEDCDAVWFDYNFFRVWHGKFPPCAARHTIPYRDKGSGTPPDAS